jgi:hypothetical protein
MSTQTQKRTTIKKLPLYTDASIAAMLKVLFPGKPVKKVVLLAILKTHKIKWPESRLYWMRRYMRNYASRALVYDRATFSYTLKGPGSAKPVAKQKTKVAADKGISLSEFAGKRAASATKPAVKKETAA